MMSSVFRAHENPRKWRFTWEAVAHIPILRLFLFNPKIEPVNQCKNLNVVLNFEESILTVTWTEVIEDRNGPSDFALRVSMPRVLVDPGSPVEFRAMEDHIVVKFVLLLPVDHPIVATFDSILDLPEEGAARKDVCSDRLQHLSLDSDLKSLSSREGVHFYCKSCLNQLTRRPLRSFVEMPSINWREVADNWFGACCCSFGGISEKLVTKYVNSYICSEGTCLVDVASVIVCKTDLVGYVFPDCSVGSGKHDCVLGLVGEEDLTKTVIDTGVNCDQGLCCGSQSEGMSDVCKKLSCMLLEEESSAAKLEGDDTVKGNVHTSICTSGSILDFSGNVTSAHEVSVKDHCNCCADKTNFVLNHGHEGCCHSLSVTCTNVEDQASTKSIELVAIQKLLLNGCLGNGFIIKSSNLSKDVEWIEFLCSKCSCVLGAYPSVSDDYAPLDGGVRLFKCYISTGLPVGGSDDIFRNHSLQRMFANQLLESAIDELSFRTVLRDLRTKSPILRIVLLNPDAWCCTGYCLETVGSLGPVSKVDLHPVIKVLFSDCSSATKAQSRMIEEWATKNQADEVYMLGHQIEELIKCMKSAQQRFPFSCSFLQGFYLSSIERHDKKSSPSMLNIFAHNCIEYLWSEFYSVQQSDELLPKYWRFC